MKDRDAAPLCMHTCMYKYVSIPMCYTLMQSTHYVRTEWHPVHMYTYIFLHVLVNCDCLLGVKRGRSEVLVSPAVKKRRMRPSQDEGEESLSDVTESLPPNQRNLFEGFSFLLTHRPKEDKHYGKGFPPPLPLPPPSLSLLRLSPPSSPSLPPPSPSSLSLLYHVPKKE